MAEQSLFAEFRGVRFRYPGQVADLFEDVTLEIRPAGVVMLAGPNGSGKSTVLGLLSGRLFPAAGSVRVFGQDPHKATRAPDLGLITEPFHPEQGPLPVDLTVRQILTWLEIVDMVDSSAIASLLDELGLARSLLDHPIRILSKGERQRVMLLVVLARKPRLLLADEPLEGLDRETRRLIGQCLDRFEFRLLTPSGDEKEVHISSLFALPGVVAEHLGRP